jgi:flagellar biosynthesis protein FlhB
MIRQVALQARVPVLASAALAQALRAAEEGDEIPEATFDAVAQLLARPLGEP